MKTISLTNSDQVALVDDVHYAYLVQWRWQLHTAGYACRSVYTGNKYSDACLMHNVIMNAKGIDHIDTNRLNNQCNNLRIGTKSQNGANSRKLQKGTSVYKGVSWHKQNKGWKAQITYNYKTIYLGCFNNEIDAAKAYNEKALVLFGAFARVNEV